LSGNAAESKEVAQDFGTALKRPMDRAASDDPLWDLLREA